jgi:hypothetical protein
MNILNNINKLIEEITFYTNIKTKKQDLKETEDVRNDMRSAWFQHFKTLGTFKWDK